MSQADLGKLRDDAHGKIGAIAHEGFKCLKKHSPKLAIDIIMLSFPRFGEKGWGACQLLEEGLPRMTKLSVQNLRALGEPMTSNFKIFGGDGKPPVDPADGEPVNVKKTMKTRVLMMFRSRRKRWKCQSQILQRIDTCGK